jgi:hypothetical protein
MSSCSDEAIPGQPIVLGCGQLCLDYLVTVASFPIPDQKIRGTSFKVQGGGNTGNALTCVARLGLPCRILAKVYYNFCVLIFEESFFALIYVLKFEA